MKNIKMYLFRINYFLMVLVPGLCVCGCAKQSTQKNGVQEIFYYANTSDVYSESIQLDSTNLLFNRYYPNKTLLEEVKCIKADSFICARFGRKVDWITHGPCVEYYEDGFPKQSYMVDSGLVLCPKITGEMVNHKIIVDIHKEKRSYKGEGEDTAAFDFHRFRVYVEGIPLAHYEVSIISRGNYMRDPLKCDYKLTASCTISPVPNSQIDTSTVEIDETLYQYILTEYDNKWCLRDSNGVQGYLFGIHYADTTGWIGETPRETVFVPFQSDF